MERIFSRGRRLLSHVRSRLSVTSTRAVLCLGLWSTLGLVDDNDLRQVGKLPDVEKGGAEEDNDEMDESVSDI